jgi:hypothetical protein
MTVADALARAQSRSDARLRSHIKAFLALRGESLCALCPRSMRARYPDYRCAEHTVYVEGRTGLDKRQADNDPERYLSVWRAFFEDVSRVLRT